MAEILGRIKADIRLQRIILCFMGVLAAVSLVQGCKNAVLFSQDFQWDSARALSLRLNPYDISLNTAELPEKYDFEEYYLQMEANQFPSLLLLLLPYTFLPPLTARYAWLLSNLAFTAGIILLLRKTFLNGADRFIFAFFMLLMIAGTPYRNQLGVGQHTLFAFFFFLLAVYCIDKQEGLSLKAALALFVCYFKYTLTVPLAVYFIYRRRLREVFVSAGLHVLLTGFCAWWLNDSFINMLLKPLRVSAKLAGEGGIDLGALLKGSPLAYALAFMVLCFLVFLTFRFSAESFKEAGSGHRAVANESREGSVSERKAGSHRDRDALLISILTLWSLILTYHRTYDFFVIVIVLAFMLTKRCPDRLKYLYALTLAAVFFGLRLFSESVPSRIAAGIIYYAFTILVTCEGFIVNDKK
ncbi:MAG TPA: hypothetical protein DCL38_00905 [Lachnospiraceae bacterium]|nr:hypothetical protein [Lachnospiraceae bacterium]